MRLRSRWRGKDNVDRGLDRTITDLLVDVIGGRVGEIGVQRAVSIALVEQQLAQGGDARGRIAVSA